MISRFAVLAFTVFFIFTSCDDGNNTSRCGDNFRDFDEECDGNNLNGQTCLSLGYYGGSLSCNDTCSFNTNSCASSGYCGDGILNGDEECDGNELNQKTCATVGYLGGGTLKCSKSCHFDKSECTGDGLCGNDIADGADEECDGNDFKGQTCITMGFYGGVLHCNQLCRTDTSECIAAGKCGDGIVHDAYNEECDGTNLNGKTCIMLGYNGGELLCDSSCHFDVSSCEGTGTCGDGILQSDYEECDGNLLGNDTCRTLGYYGGYLSCTDTCRYDLNACRDAGWCGDGSVQTEQEQCDMTDLNGQTCESLGYYGGSLSCRNDCNFDVSACEPFGWCGDGILQSAYEQCDGTNLNGTTCEALGYYPGELSCGIACDFDTSGCGPYGHCGDGTAQAGVEECDATDFLFNCEDLGFQPDLLTTCFSDCTADISVCKTKWILISSGNSHTCGLKSDNTLYCWGYNTYGQLGTGNNDDQNTPQQVGTDTWSTVSVFGSHTCAIKSDGKLYCWGWNAQGQLGIGNNDNKNTPQQIGTDTWDFISAGNSHTCAIKSDGTLYCWGNNNEGELGTGDNTNQNTPQHIGTYTDWRSVAAGGSHTCAIRSNNTLYCWGHNYYGQLGTNDASNKLVPYQVDSAVNWSAITTGNNHTCAVKTDNTIYCWGYNHYGQLGTDNTTDNYIPQQTGSDTDWNQISANGNQTCGTKSDGKLYCWGSNEYGQIGLGSTTPYMYDTPQQISTDFSSVSAGNSHTCAVKSDGKLYCWGRNNHGQLGSGDTTNRTVPSRVIF